MTSILSNIDIMPTNSTHQRCSVVDQIYVFFPTHNLKVKSKTSDIEQISSKPPGKVTSLLCS